MPVSGTSGKDFPLRFPEFIALVAALMALNALSIDPMLPALPAMGEALGIVEDNQRQWIVSSYFAGLGIGSLFYGSLSDNFGRKPVLLVSLSLYLLAGVFCALAQDFTVMLTGRAAQGFFAAATRVVAISIVRDRFVGDRMASIMSTVFIVFMIVPILAPTFGQLILYVANWRWIFIALLIIGAIVMAWTALRLPETLTPQNRVHINIGDITTTFWTIITNRTAFGYMMATGIAMGALIGFITSVQQIFFDIFHLPDVFPYAFAGIAGFMALGSFCNSRLVERIGARRMSQGSLMFFIALSAVHSGIALAGMETVWSFVVIQALTMLSFAFTGSNFGSISMESFSRGAGAASSFQACLTTLISAMIGTFIGSQFNGTTAPLALGFLSCGLLSLLWVFWAERGRLFTRPRTPKIPQPLR
ncbi:multidrug effflux MFS transporter [Rhizorhapis sp. SPR117]|nr:multidrug effflux MFS transporter [Rhizorhapis sp. SPR117]